MYKLFLMVRYLRSRVIAFFAIAAVMLCAAMVLVVMSVMGGWLQEVRARARGLLGDAIIDNRTYSGFPLYQEFIDEIEAWPEVVQATPVIYSYALYQFPDTNQNGTVRVMGIRLDEIVKVNAFGESLFYEQYYPGTTSLAEQEQPLLGRDLSVEPRKTPEGDSVYWPLMLPEPYQSALEATRRQHEQDFGAPLADDGAMDSDQNIFLRSVDEPIIPGRYEFNFQDEPNATVPMMAGPAFPGVIFGRDLVAVRESDGRYKRLYPRGQLAYVTLMKTNVRGNVDPVPIKQPFRMTDDSRTGVYEIDSQHIYVDFDLLQRLLEMDAGERIDGGKIPARCSQIQIKFAPGVDPYAMCGRFESLYKSYLSDERFDLDMDDMNLVMRIDAVTWEESQAHIIGPVERERVMLLIVLSIIALVAIALVLCILYMIVIQKTRDIGIIKALGGSSSGVGSVFIIYGAAIGLVGGVMGLVFGGVFVAHLNDVQDLLIAINPAWRVWDLKVYSFDKIPSTVNPFEGCMIVLVSVVASTLGALAAAWRAAAMQPVEALRYE